MKGLANPIVLRAVVVFFCAGVSFLVGMILIRRLRQSIDEETAGISADPKPTLETLPLHLYNTVIQQLKQQKHELQVQTQVEQRRARTTENFSQAVLSNLSCGVLVFDTNGLVKQCNPAAREILGFASATGMGAADIFRDAVVSSAISASSSQDPSTDECSTQPYLLSDEVYSVLQEASSRRQVEADYIPPSGQTRRISVTITSVPCVEGGLLGAACLITDLSAFEQIRQEQQLHGEVSAEMALSLRTSLDTISDYARQLAGSHDAELTRQLAQDIANEAAHLDRRIGGFLAGKSTLKTLSAEAGSAD